MNKIKILGRLGYILFCVAIAFLIKEFSYSAGVNATTAEYEKKLHDQKVAFDADRQSLSLELTKIKRTSANKAAQVEKHFIPVERKVIEYVSKPKNSRDEQCNFTEWMRLHNRAAEGAD